jgi:hypothetical protein
MRSLLKYKSDFPGFYPVFFAVFAVGVYLRLDQFSLQVLLDDEWHVIHQLLVKTPAELFQSFGLADFSIPLALFYWLESNLFGLTEMGMRWPMMLAGISALLVFPLYIRKSFGDKVSLVFLFLFAISPRLILYSRTARPYALTLLLSMLAIVAFQKFVEAEKCSLKAGLVYVLCAAVSVWLHLISLPLVVAPFLVYGLPALFKRDWSRMRRIVWLGLFTFVGLLAVVLPPLLGHPEDISVRLGLQLPNLQTFVGLFFVWMGTSSLIVVLAGLFFAVLGAGPVWRQLPISASLISGLGLTLVLILITQPAWVNYPITLARYLLPALPLFLLSVALGVSRLGDVLAVQWGARGKYMSIALTLAAIVLMAYYSPLPKILANPNSNSLHSVYQFDFREDNNLVYQYQKDFPVSPFWQQLASLPGDSIKIAASPFYFETHHWDAARWEQISHQRVMPGYLTGFCKDFWWGEVPKNKRYQFKNVGYLSDQNDLKLRGFDFVVYQKPFVVQTNQGEKEFGMNTADCERKLRELYPAPVYEDKWLLVFPLSDKMREQISVTR